MIRGLYASATGMMALMGKQDVISNNLANATTAGYKRDYLSITTFPEAMVYATEKQIGAQGTQSPIGLLGPGVGISKTGFINTNGALRHTGSAFDLALSGDGFFTIATPEGERYTRNGGFAVDGRGRLVNHDGHFVLGERGFVEIAGDEVIVDEAGRIYVDGSYVDTLKIRRFAEGALEKSGSNMFEARDEGEAADVVVRQRYLEGSNVDVGSELVEMITTVRSFEANQRILKSQDEMLGRAVNEVGRVG